MKRILLLATGGTIASVPTDHGLSPGTSAQELISFIPEAARLCHLQVRQVFSLDSTNIQPEHWCRLAEELEAEYHNYDGFLITHGTDTMAYTAAALSYLVQNSKKPIILTGAQKPIQAGITDARKNLLDSLRFALEDGVQGVYVVFDGKAIVGTRARKIRTKSFSAFESINYPTAAFIDERRIVRYVDQAPPPAPERFSHALNPRVLLLKLIPGMEPDVLEYAAARCDALVVESYGVGGIPFSDRRNFLEKMERLTDLGKIVVITTQVMLEGSDAAIYEVGYQAIHRCNVLQGYDMTTEAVAVKLMWILAQTRDFQAVRRAFYTPVNHDILYQDKEGAL